VSKCADWVRQHQVLSFYLLVFGISWPAMIVTFWVFPQNAAAQAPFGLIATFSPVLIALIIARISRPGQKRNAAPHRRVLFMGAWLFSWIVLVLHTWQIREVPISAQVVIPTGLVALLPGWLISCAYSSIPGVRQLFGTLIRPRGHWLWFIAAFSIVPVIQLLGAGITVVFGGEVDFNLGNRSFAAAPVFIGLTFLNGLLVSGGINEETGWRGFVLPRLQARFSVIIAITIVWFFWALWHLPYDIGTGTPLEGILVNRTLHNFIFALLMAWLFNRSQGSLLAPVLFHPAMNTFGDTLPRTDAGTVLLLLLVVMVIFYDRMWEKLPRESKAVYTDFKT
jgi:membrane protease YdiL (CAAX protease family)